MWASVMIGSFLMSMGWPAEALIIKQFWQGDKTGVVFQLRSYESLGHLGEIGIDR